MAIPRPRDTRPRRPKKRESAPASDRAALTAAETEARKLVATTKRRDELLGFFDSLKAAQDALVREHGENVWLKPTHARTLFHELNREMRRVGDEINALPGVDTRDVGKVAMKLLVESGVAPIAYARLAGVPPEDARDSAPRQSAEEFRRTHRAQLTRGLEHLKSQLAELDALADDGHAPNTEVRAAMRAEIAAFQKKIELLTPRRGKPKK